MKKIIALAIVGISIITTLDAIPLKKRVKELEKEIAFLARNEKKSWDEIARLNNEVARLEQRSLKNYPQDTHDNNAVEQLSKFLKHRWSKINHPLAR